MAEYKDNMIKKYINEPFKTGDDILVPLKNFAMLRRFHSDKAAEDKLCCRIVDIISDNKYAVRVVDRSKVASYNKNDLYAVVDRSQMEKSLFNIGYNPFNKRLIEIGRNLRKLDLDIEGIVFYLHLPVNEYKDMRKGTEMTNGVVVPETNFNPFVYNYKGEKEYYQRDYVWTLEEEQSFIDSIYKGVDCGKIVVRNRSLKYVENAVNRGDTKDLGFRDIVDGKQRLHTLIRFMNDEFTDSNGMYYSDLSECSKLEFDRSQCISFLEMLEDTTDEQTIDTFLFINFSGKLLSKEHIERVKEIRKNII